MSEMCLLPSGIMTDPRFLSVSLLARYLYLAMDLVADHEGRGPAHPSTWKAQASLWGVAEVDLAAISDAIRALHGVGLIVLYDEDHHFFLPDRFEHNRARKFWQASKHPLPPLELVHHYPSYLEGLSRLTTKGRLYDNTSEPRRYPELRRRSDRAPACPGDKGELGGRRGELGGIQGEGAGPCAEGVIAGLTLRPTGRCPRCAGSRVRNLFRRATTTATMGGGPRVTFGAGALCDHSGSAPPAGVHRRDP
ncbi:MAG: hypothetical protein R6X16_03640, partial [Anaerolineae bacterium]